MAARGGVGFGLRALLSAIIGLGLLASFFVAWQRAGSLGVDTNTELAVDYTQAWRFATEESLDPERFLLALKEAGVTSVTLPGITLDQMEGRGLVVVSPGYRLLDFRRLLGGEGEIPGKAPAPDRTYVLTREEVTARWVHEALARILGKERVSLSFAGGVWLVGAAGDEKELRPADLGPWPADAAWLRDRGFRVIPVLTNYRQIRPQAVDELFRGLADQAGATTVLFAGDEVPGYPDLVGRTALRLREAGLVAAVMEHRDQAGMAELARRTGYRVVRAFKVYPSYGPYSIWLAAKDRNIRLFIIRDFRRPEGPAEAGYWPRRPGIQPGISSLTGEATRPGADGAGDTASRPEQVMALNVRWAGELKAVLRETGFGDGPPSPFRTYRAPLWGLALAGAAVAGGAGALVAAAGVSRTRSFLPSLTVALLLGALAVRGPWSLQGREVLALVAAVVYPVLAVWLATGRAGDVAAAGRPAGADALPAAAAGGTWFRMAWPGVKALLVAVSVSATGGFLIHALLADTSWALQLDVFRGVKVAYAAPFLILAVLYLREWLAEGRGRGRGSAGGRGKCRPGESRTGRDAAGHEGIWERLAERPVLVLDMILLIFLVAGGIVYIGRSGHTLGLPVPDLEMKARVWLELVTGARPRLKEFLVGHPALVLGMAVRVAGDRRAWTWVLLLLGVVGQTSIVNSFSHLHTPLAVTLARTFFGLVLGIAAGCAAAYLAGRFSRSAFCVAPGRVRAGLRDGRTGAGVPVAGSKGTGKTGAGEEV